VVWPQIHGGTLARKQSSEALRRPPKLLWVSLPLTVIGSLILGYIGFSRALTGQTVYGHHTLDLIYYDLQLFVLGADPLQGYKGKFPATLQAARFAAPATTVYAVVEGVRLLLAVELSRIMARRASGHAIVCGDTAIADALTRRLRSKGAEVVEIRTGLDEFVAAGEPLRIIGDARDPEVLRAAGVRRAGTLYACADSSATNIAVSLAVARAAGQRGAPLFVHSLVLDPDFCATVQAFFLGRPAAGRVRLDFFNVDHIAARRLFTDAGSWPSQFARSSTPPHLIVAGTDGLAQAIVVEAARYWRLRDYLDQPVPLRLTLVGPDATIVVTALSHRYPFLESVCLLQAYDEELLVLMSRAALSDPPDRVLITHQDEEYALKTAMTAERYWRGLSGPITVRLDGALVGATTSSGGLDVAAGTVTLFSAVSAAGDPDLIEDDLTERLARILHDRYVIGRRARADVSTKRALVPWDELPLELRAANRSQAEDIGHKLAEIGYVITPRISEQLADELSDADIERLVLLEHERWRREMERAGWSYAPQLDEERKLHPGLLIWEDLPQALRLRTYDPIRALPSILGDAGFQIVRA
jgi:voltage-gated potassium channel Kch